MALGKTLILGDSYSTFAGKIPEGYHAWYFPEKSEQTDVYKPEQTWWYQVFTEKDNILLRNDSFSGTTICNTVRPEHSIEFSFINRFDKLVKEGFFKKNKVDTVLVFGGTNDSWIDCPIGEIKFDDFSDNDLLKVLPACGYLGKSINNAAPNARVCWLINTDLKDEIVDGIIKTATNFRQDYIRFTEIDKMSSHPSIAGMKQIAEKVTKFFE